MLYLSRCTGHGFFSCSFFCRLPGILLDDKRCVDKTFPTFWDDISHYLHVPTAPPADAARALSLAPRAADSSVRAVVVIGMR